MPYSLLNGLSLNEASFMASMEAYCEMSIIIPPFGPFLTWSCSSDDKASRVTKIADLIPSRGQAQFPLLVSSQTSPKIFVIS